MISRSVRYVPSSQMLPLLSKSRRDICGNQSCFRNKSQRRLLRLLRVSQKGEQVFGIFAFKEKAHRAVVEFDSDCRPCARKCSRMGTRS